MATYKQWRVNADAGQVRRVTWVCGSETLLVEEVVDYLTSKLAPGPTDHVVVVAGTVPDREVYAALNQLPMSTPRLVVVREAQALSTFAPFCDWALHLGDLPGVYAVMVSRETGPLDTKRPEHAVCRDKGHLIRCSPLAEPEGIAWVARRAAVGAEDIYRIAGGDLKIASDLARKVAVLGIASTPDVLVALVGSPAGDFTDALLGGHKAEAMRAAQSVGPNDYGRIIGALDAELDVVARLHAGFRRRESIAEIANRASIPVFRAAKVATAAKDYDHAKVRSAHLALALADDAIRSGARDGVLEALVTLW